jgi:hypothetical protein
MLAVAFAGMGFAAAYGAGTDLGRWVVVIAAASLALWLGSMAIRALK